jgi:hypothetical protein
MNVDGVADAADPNHKTDAAIIDNARSLFTAIPFT